MKDEEVKIKRHSKITYILLAIILLVVVYLTVYKVMNLNPVRHIISNRAYKQILVYQNDLNEYISSEQENVDFSIASINATSEEMKKYIPNIKSAYYDDIAIQNGKIVYINRDLENRKEIAMLGVYSAKPVSYNNILMWYGSKSKNDKLESFNVINDLSKYQAKASINSEDEKDFFSNTADGFRFKGTSYLITESENIKSIMRYGNSISYEFNVTLPKKIKNTPLTFGSRDGYLNLSINKDTKNLEYIYTNEENEFTKAVFNTNKYIKKNLGKTVHIVLTSEYINGIQDLCVYINGELVDNIKENYSYSESLFEKSNKLYIGGNVLEENAVSTINTIRVYNIKLTEDQVRYNYYSEI